MTLTFIIYRVGEKSKREFLRKTFELLEMRFCSLLRGGIIISVCCNLSVFLH